MADSPVFNPVYREHYDLMFDEIMSVKRSRDIDISAKLVHEKETDHKGVIESNTNDANRLEDEGQSLNNTTGSDTTGNIEEEYFVGLSILSACSQSNPTGLVNTPHNVHTSHKPILL